MSQLDDILLRKRIECILSSLRFSTYFVGDLLQVTNKRNQKKNTKLNVKKIFSFMVCLVLILYTIYYGLAIGNVVNFSETVRIVLFGMVFMGGMQTLFMIASITSIMQNFLRALAVIDLALYQNKQAMSSLSYDRLRKNADKRLLIILICFVLKQGIAVVSFKLNPLLIISLSMFEVFNYLLTFLFVSCCEQSVERLLRVQRVFEDLHRYVENQPQITDATISKKITDRLYCIFKINNKICRMIREGFASFSLTVTFSFWLLAIRVLFYAYMLYNACFNGATPTIFDIIHPIIILIHDSSILFLIVWNCERIGFNVNEFHKLLHKLRNIGFNIEIENHIQMYSLQLIHQKVNMSALGLFDINNSALYGVFMGVITYMILMIQFDQNPRQTTKMVHDS